MAEILLPISLSSFTLQKNSSLVQGLSRLYGNSILCRTLILTKIRLVRPSFGRIIVKTPSFVYQSWSNNSSYIDIFKAEASWIGDFLRQSRRRQVDILLETSEAVGIRAREPGYAEIGASCLTIKSSQCLQPGLSLIGLAWKLAPGVYQSRKRAFKCRPIRCSW